MEVINVLSANVTIKSHPTDSGKVILTVSGTDYIVDANEVLQAVHNSLNN